MGKLTLGHIQDVVKEISYYVFPNTQLTVCCIELKNGFTVIGESACVKPELFNKEVGEQIAYNKAFSKIWVLEGYLMKQKSSEVC